MHEISVYLQISIHFPHFSSSRCIPRQPSLGVRTRSSLKNGLQGSGAQLCVRRLAGTTMDVAAHHGPGRIPGGSSVSLSGAIWCDVLRPLWSKPETFGLTSWPETSAVPLASWQCLDQGWGLGHPGELRPAEQHEVIATRN